MLAFREVLGAEPGAGPAMKADVGRSLMAVASLLQQTGRTEESLVTYRKAELLLDGTAGGNPAARPLADCRAELGHLLHRTGHSDEGLIMLLRARADHEARPPTREQ